MEVEKYQNLSRNPFLSFKVSIDKMLGPKTKFYIPNFVYIDFRRERCDPESRGLFNPNRPVLGLRTLL